jgi:hypothetical protein
MAQQAAAHHRVGRVDRDVQWRQPVLQNPLHVPRLQVGECREVPVAEGEAVVVVPDVQRLPQPLRKAVHEAEVTPVGAAPDARRVELDPQGGVVRPLHVVLDGLPLRGAGQQHEALLGREELPIEEVRQLAPVDGEQLEAGGDPELGPDGIGMHGLHPNHVGIPLPWIRLASVDVLR